MESDVLPMLAALGHAARLRIFVYVCDRPAGAYAGSIGEAVGLTPSALSFHLRVLTQAGLLSASREQQRWRYTARHTKTLANLEKLTKRLARGSIASTSVQPNRRRRVRGS